MNCNNFLLPHVALALVVILIAALPDRIRKWQKNEWRQTRVAVRHELRAGPVHVPPSSQGAPAAHTEVLVRFKPGVSADRIQSIVSNFNDEVEDQIEAVSGLDVIEDEDGRDVASVLSQYRALPEVEYADEIFTIHVDAFNPVLPNDPRFDEQWALVNNGQNGGTKGADISASVAWAKTKGSDDVVVAVLDSGVDYTHPDLVTNIG
jgi:subtilisin family serine protease